MLLTVGLGNTNIAFGLFDGTWLQRHGHVPVDELQFLPEHVGDTRFSQVALASVAPSVTGRAVSLLAMRYNAPVLLAGRDLPYGIEIECDDPGAVGADRLLNAIAAHARTRAATIVADVGTAVTVDLVSASGTFCGGAIAPGPDTMRLALYEHAELLPHSAPGKPPSPIGRNTADAIRSGAYWGAVGLVEGLIGKLAEERSGPVRVIVTGGNGEFVAREMKTAAEFVPALTLEGLAILAAKGGAA